MNSKVKFALIGVIAGYAGSFLVETMLAKQLAKQQEIEADAPTGYEVRYYTYKVTDNFYEVMDSVQDTAVAWYNYPHQADNRADELNKEHNKYA